MKTVVFFVLLWLSLLLSLLLFIPVLFIRLTGYKKAELEYIQFWTSSWARFVIFLSGSTVEVSGSEKIPENPDFLIVSNHQSVFDIPLIMSVFPYSVGFIAKEGLRFVPFINAWILALRGIFISRDSYLKTFRKLERDLSKNRKNPLLIFPEGSRSKRAKPLPLRKASMNLIRANTKQRIYVFISGSFQAWEENDSIKAAQIEVRLFRKEDEQEWMECLTKLNN